MEELKVDTTSIKTEENIIEELSWKKIIPRRTSYLGVPVPSPSTDKTDQKEKFLKEIERQKDIPFPTKEEMETETRDVYDALIPEGYDEIMLQAHDAFDKLDAYIAINDELLAREEQARKESMGSNIKISTEETEKENSSQAKGLEVPQNDEETDIKHEDINNL